jgi:hypothetical protein
MDIEVGHEDDYATALAAILEQMSHIGQLAINTRNFTRKMKLYALGNVLGTSEPKEIITNE